jgi:hypothetical protein
MAMLGLFGLYVNILLKWESLGFDALFKVYLIGLAKSVTFARSLRSGYRPMAFV